MRFEGMGERKIVFRKDITQVNLEEILLNGVLAIPWKMVSLDTNNFIVLREFQYITLTSGDSLRGLVLDTKNGKDYLDNEWTFVDQSSPCYYAFSDTTMKDGGTPLPKFNLIDTSTGSTNKGSKIGWEVRSYLELNMGPGCTPRTSPRHPRLSPRQRVSRPPRWHDQVQQPLHPARQSASPTLVR